MWQMIGVLADYAEDVRTWKKPAPTQIAGSQVEAGEQVEDKAALWNVGGRTISDVALSCSRHLSRISSVIAGDSSRQTHSIKLSAIYRNVLTLSGTLESARSVQR